MDSLQHTDNESAAVAVAQRVTLADIKASIRSEYYMTADHIMPADKPCLPEDSLALRVLTVCIIVMSNGFTVIGKAAPASPQNFNPELGRKFAYEDAVRQIWPLMGFCLRDHLAREENKPLPKPEVPAAGE